MSFGDDFLNERASIRPPLMPGIMSLKTIFTMPEPFFIFIPLFILFFVSVLRLFFLERKILERLKIVDNDKWKDLIWLFDKRAHPIRFRQYVKGADTSDLILKKQIIKYRSTSRLTFILWTILAAITFAIILFTFALKGLSS